VKTIVGLFAAAALVGLATSAAAQPPGSYRDSCRDIRMQGFCSTHVKLTMRSWPPIASPTVRPR